MRDGRMRAPPFSGKLHRKWTGWTIIWYTNSDVSAWTSTVPARETREIPLADRSGDPSCKRTIKCCSSCFVIDGFKALRLRWSMAPCVLTFSLWTSRSLGFRE